MSVHKLSAPVTSPWGEIIEEWVGGATPNSTTLHSVARITVPAGVTAPAHHHPVAEESYTVLSGSGSVRIGDRTATFGPGDCVAIQPKVVHAVSVPADAKEPLVMLVVCSPPWTPECSIYEATGTTTPPASAKAAAAKPKPKVSDKQAAAAKKEGGKKAQDIAGLEAMGGVTFFTLSLANTIPDAIDYALEGMNEEVDESTGERKGGAGGLGKFLVSADPKKLTFRVHVPAALTGKLSAEEWLTEVIKRTGKDIPFEKLGDGLLGGTVEADPDKSIYAEKIRDELVAHSFPFLRSKGLIPEDDDDDEFICDPEAAGIGSW